MTRPTFNVFDATNNTILLCITSQFCDHGKQLLDVCSDCVSLELIAFWQEHSELVEVR